MDQNLELAHPAWSGAAMLRLPLLVRSRPGLAARRLASTQPPLRNRAGRSYRVVVRVGENHPVKKDPEWEFVGYRGGHLTYMRKKDPRYQKFKARKNFRWGLKMNAVLLGCCFLLNCVFIIRLFITSFQKNKALSFFIINTFVYIKYK